MCNCECKCCQAAAKFAQAHNPRPPQPSGPPLSAIVAVPYVNRAVAVPYLNRTMNVRW